MVRETGFGLFLRNFDLSSMSARLVADNGSDAKISAAFLARTEKIEQAISRAAEPTPLIKIHNLEDFDYVIPALELGDDWLNAVQSLVTKAAFIVFIFRGETPGVSRELELLRELRREASTILLLEKEPGSVPMDFPTQFRIGADAGLPDEAVTLIARHARDTKPLRFEDPPSSPKRFRLTGDVRRLYIATCDISLLRARFAFAAVFTGNLKKYMMVSIFAACSFAGAFMLEDEGRTAQAVGKMGYWLLYTPYIRMMGAAAFYLEYAVAKLPRTHPQSLLAAQALCIARLNVADTVGQSIAAIEAAVALESERFGALSGPRERYLHHHIQERLHARAGNSVEAQTARTLAVTAYQELRQFGEPALFSDALVISLLNFDFAMGGIQKGNLSHTGTSLAATDTVRLFMGTEAHDQLTAVLSGTADWNTLFATLQSPAALLEAEALEAAVKNAEAS